MPRETPCCQGDIAPDRRLHKTQQSTPRGSPPGRARPDLEGTPRRLEPLSHSFSRGYGTILPNSLNDFTPSTRAYSARGPVADSVRPRATITHSACFSRAVPGAPNAPKSGVLFHPSAPSLPIIGFQGPCAECWKEKKTLFGTRAGVAGVACVAAILCALWCRNINLPPFLSPPTQTSGLRTAFAV